jgi:hypothetical protein
MNFCTWCRDRLEWHKSHDWMGACSRRLGGPYSITVDHHEIARHWSFNILVMLMHLMHVLFSS